MVFKLVTFCITGGIGTGKSYVVDIFNRFHVPYIIADHVAKNLLLNDQHITEKVKKYFNVVDLHQNLKLIKVNVFKSVKSRMFLEQLIHYEVVNYINLQLANLKKTKNLYCIVELPLLANFFDIVNAINIDKIILTHCDIHLQISRVMHRDRLTKRQVLSIIRSQMPVNKIFQVVDYFIDTNKSSNLEQQIELLGIC